MTRAMVLSLAVLAGASCQGASGTHNDAPTEKATRIVSLDYCADQYVLKLADRDRILAVSEGAASDYSYMRDSADGVSTTRATAENVLALRPDLVVRAYGGGPGTTALFERAGIPVLQVGWASELAGDGPGTVSGVMKAMADGLGEPERGAKIVADYQARLAAIRADNPDRPEALYMTPGGVTTGPGSLVHQMLVAAGLENFEAEPGWRSLPLERLAYAEPDVVATAFFGTGESRLDGWSAARHPVARRQLERSEVVAMDGAWTACGGWFVIEAVEALAAGATR